MLSRLCVLAGEVNVCLCRPVQIQLEEVEGDYEKHFNELQEKLVLLIQNNQEKVRVCGCVAVPTGHERLRFCEVLVCCRCSAWPMRLRCSR